jgi:tetratricopeptide (TPR) repeat protein
MARAATGQAEWAKLSPDLRKIFVAETTRYYESLIQGAGTEPSARYETAVGYRSLGFLHGSAKEFEPAEKYYRQSIEMLEALVKESPDNREYRDQLAFSNFHLGSVLKATTRPADATKAYERAVELYEALIGEADTPREEHSYNLNQCYVALGQLDPARSLQTEFRERLVTARRALIERDSKNYAHYAQLGHLLRQQNKFDEAAAAYSKAVELNPSDAGSYQNLTTLLQRQGKIDQAVAAGRKAVELNPKAAGAWVNLGNALWGARKFDEAAAAFRQAIDLDPKDGKTYGDVGNPPSVSPQVAAYGNLARMLHQQKKLDEAAAVFRELIERDPKLASAHFELGGVLVDQKRHPDALAEFKKALDLDPKSAQVHNDVAWLLATASDAQVRDPDQALALAKKAVELEPKNGGYLNTRGVARYRSSDWTGAIADLEKSMELRKGGDSSDWFFLAMARWQLGERDKARDSYDEAVKWMEKNAPKHPVLIGFRNEAAALLGVNESK